MKIGIVDADLLGRKNHRFPNLACEKISGFWKRRGHDVLLLDSFDFDDSYDEVFVSKVFTDTPVPEWLQPSERVHIGGTGFFFDQAPSLNHEIEHCMPDYHLYDEWIERKRVEAKKKAILEGKEFVESKFIFPYKEYTDYSIGFITRGCFRKCKFCVNQKYDRVFAHSPLEEFYDPERKKICLLDDNFLGYAEWKHVLKQLIETGKPFKFKQGLDERLLNEEKCELLFSANYDGDYTFAFDNIKDYELIDRKLKIIRRYIDNPARVKFYVLVGFESTDAKDIENAFKRIELLMRYGCLPYVMRYQNKNDTPWKESKYSGIYIQLARWANQPSLFRSLSFRQFCNRNQQYRVTDRVCAPVRALELFETDYPSIAAKYFDLRYKELRI